MKKIFHNISVLHGVDPEDTFKTGKQMQELNSLNDAYFVVENGLIAKFGTGECTEEGEFISLGGCEVLPGFVDSHTHIVFAAPRHDEFEMRIRGASYEEIAAAGGGILNSALKLKAMSEDDLFEHAKNRVITMIQHGTTAIEIKSGYGLSVDSEIKMLRVIKRLKEHFPAIIKATFLGAHAFPKEFKSLPDDYIKLVVNDMLPQIIAEDLADHIDVFCDRGFFTPEQTDIILKAGKKYGLPGKIHGNELGLTGGVQVAVANEAWSVDHLEHCSEVEFELIRNSMLQPYGGTMPVALPGTSYFLGIPYSPVRKMIDFGLPVALASDFNPGSSPICSLQIIWALACTQMKLLPIEAFHAITINAARTMRLEQEIGSFTIGKRADFVLVKEKSAIQAIPYFAGQNHVASTYISGELFEASKYA